VCRIFALSVDVAFGVNPIIGVGFIIRNFVYHFGYQHGGIGVRVAKVKHAAITVSYVPSASIPYVSIFNPMW
jgi:hypothetical protein